MWQVGPAALGSHLVNALEPELEEIDAVVAFDHHRSHVAMMVDLTKMIDDRLRVETIAALVARETARLSTTLSDHWLSAGAADRKTGCLARVLPSLWV